MSKKISYGNKKITISNRDKVLFPEKEITKGNLIDYYHDISSIMLPHMRERPLTLQRYPEGIQEEGFIQQEFSDYFPDWLGQARTPLANDKRKSILHPVCNDKASLLYLANQAVITFHGWLSCNSALEYPDKLVFDLDPYGDDFSPVCRAAGYVRGLMEALGMTAFVMTTGSRGLHVIVPLKPDTQFDTVRDYAKIMSKRLAENYPNELTTEQRKAHRGKRIYLDVMRNAYGQTSVLPYSVRDKPLAPVATPLDWDEINDSNPGPQSYHLKNIRRRLGQRDDPWKDIRRHAVSLSKRPDPDTTDL
ncbi:non-homologous end-joining DNA ligase [Thiohalophilus sp.]|uniref:non-homologous end-joining DNA ligase n=1 Tax=Thiohalophilus sp. TaxID=3028392 RepID=UPI0039767AD3